MARHGLHLIKGLLTGNSTSASVSIKQSIEVQISIQGTCWSSVSNVQYGNNTYPICNIIIHSVLWILSLSAKKINTTLKSSIFMKAWKSLIFWLSSLGFKIVQCSGHYQRFLDLLAPAWVATKNEQTLARSTSLRIIKVAKVIVKVRMMVSHCTSAEEMGTPV